METSEMTTADAPVEQHDSIEAPEAPAPNDAGLADGDNPDASEAGQPRDEHGRFASRQAADQGEDTADGNADETADAPDAQAPNAAPASPTATEQPGTPFSITHRGTPYVLQGATLDAEGHLRVTREQVPRLQQMLASAREYETVGRQREQQFVQAIRERDARLEARHAGWSAIEQAIIAGDEVQAVTALLDLRQRWPQMQLEARQAELDAREAALNGEGQQQGAPDEMQALAQQVFHSTISHLSEMRKQVPEFAGLTDDDLKVILPEVVQSAYVYVREATPQDEMLHGIEAGSPMFDLARFARVARQAAAPLLQSKAQAEEKKRRAAAERAASRMNAGKNGGVNTPPPAPGTRINAAPAQGNPDGKITADDWRRMRGG